MENEKVQLDEKTARIIEEMDKSLKNMEQAMGPDHMVVAKILDSYAKLLRQKNIRHLDALNMEARAKHIRAKLNQQEDKAQSEGITTTHAQTKSMSTGQARVLVWCVAAVVLSALAYGTYGVIRDTSKMKAGALRLRNSGAPTSMVGDSNAAPLGTGKVEDVPQEAPTPQSIEQQVNQAAATTAPPQASAENEAAAAAIAKRTSEVKSFAKEKLAEAMQLESNKDFPAAAQTYASIINTAKQASSEIGRPIYSESIAQALEGYGRMAALDNHPDVAESSDKAAADVRSHITSGDE